MLGSSDVHHTLIECPKAFLKKVGKVFNYNYQCPGWNNLAVVTLCFHFVKPSWRFIKYVLPIMVMLLDTLTRKPLTSTRKPWDNSSMREARDRIVLFPYPAFLMREIHTLLEILGLLT